MHAEERPRRTPCQPRTVKESRGRMGGEGKRPHNAKEGGKDCGRHPTERPPDQGVGPGAKSLLGPRIPTNPIVGRGFSSRPGPFHGGVRNRLGPSDSSGVLNQPPFHLPYPATRLPYPATRLPFFHHSSTSPHRDSCWGIGDAAFLCIPRLEGVREPPRQLFPTGDRGLRSHLWVSFQRRNPAPPLHSQ